MEVYEGNLGRMRLGKGGGGTAVRKGIWDKEWQCWRVVGVVSEVDGGADVGGVWLISIYGWFVGG